MLKCVLREHFQQYIKNVKFGETHDYALIKRKEKKASILILNRPIGALTVTFVFLSSKAVVTTLVLQDIITEESNG